MLHKYKFMLLISLSLLLLACAGPAKEPISQNPSVKITSAGKTNSPDYTLRATVTSSNPLIALSHTLNGAAPQTISPVNSTPEVTLNLNLGDNTITLSAEDSAGRRGSAQLTVTYDPELELSGKLSVQISGLPAGADANVTVLIPGVFVKNLSQSTLLEDLEPADYTITARNISTASGEYVADPPQQTTSVQADQTTPAEVSYTRQNPELGSLAVTISGLPAGTTADVTVTGPGGFNQRLSKSSTLLNLLPGSYTISAAQVSAGGEPYTPAPTTQSVTVVFGQTANAAVSYTGPQTGSLELSILGLPSGVSANVSVTNLGGFSDSVTGNEVLSDLAPGTYRLESARVRDNQVRYLPEQNRQTVTVTAGETTLAEITYLQEEADTGSLNIIIEGLPEGAKARVLVVDSASSQRQGLRKVEGSTTLNNLPAGTYTVIAEEVSPDSATFRPDTRNQNVDITIGATSEVTVRYTCATIKPPDSELETALRDTLNITSGELSCTDVAAITVLSVRGYGISDPELEGLQYATKLQTINLSFNKLKQLSSEAFSKLINLQYLDLSDNALTTLPSDAFIGLKNLQLLILGGNQLASLPEGIFADLSELQHLYLQGNQLASLPEGIFADLSELESLYLDENQLTTLPNTIFESLTNLMFLYLDDNQLGILPDGIFAALSNLDTLTLDNNQFTTLGNDPFAGLTKLQILWLSNNQLNTLSLRWFSELTGLIVLHLETNCLRLEQVPAEGVLARLNVAYVDTFNNPRTDLACPAIGSISNSFENGAEGWRVNGSTPDWESDGYVSVSLSPDDYLTSPGTYAGDASAYYGRTLEFDVRQTGTGAPRNCCDVLLESGSYLLSYTLPSLPGSNWSTMSVPLEVSPGWLYGGSAATEQQLRDALADLVSVKILWRYNSAPDAYGELDNIEFGSF